jgi:hypothetical protein
MVVVAACQEPNPDFDGAATSSNDTGPASTSSEGPGTSSDSTGPVVTSDGTGTSSSSGEPPGTSSGEPPGTSSGEGSTTDGCMGMVCRGECIDPMTNGDHCGMCDNNCVGQQECIDGECIVP